MIKKEQFIRYMDMIQERFYILEELYDSFEFITGGVCDRIISGTDITPMVEMLSDMIGDYDRWIEWYIYDDDWGDNHYDVRDKDGNIIPSQTYEDIWNLIMDNKECEGE